MKNQLNRLHHLGALLLATVALTTSALAGPDTQAFIQRISATTPEKQTETRKVAPALDGKSVVPEQRTQVTQFTTGPRGPMFIGLHPAVLTAGNGMVTVWRN